MVSPYGFGPMGITTTRSFGSLAAIDQALRRPRAVGGKDNFANPSRTIDVFIAPIRNARANQPPFVRVNLKHHGATHHDAFTIERKRYFPSCCHGAEGANLLLTLVA